MASSSSTLSSRTWKYDVILSFRGEDTRKNFVDHLYSALEQHGRIHTYKDDVTLPRGDSIGPSLMNAIQESQIAVVIFSENYADSSWCLEELEHIMKCRQERGQIVLPVFYNVDPSDVRKQQRKYEQAFSKHKFLERNYQKIELWRKALWDASNIAGWETKHIANGHEALGIKIIVGTILDRLLSVNSDIDEDLVGMGSRFQYMESQLLLESGGVRMVGIWGIGGGGKTTLAFSVYMKIRERFQGHCFVGNIWKGLTKHGIEQLQEKILSEVLNYNVSVPSDQEGRFMIKRMLCHRKVLIVLDDVDDHEQLEALAGSCDWFGDGSRIIITTRDKQVLISHKVEVCHVSLLSFDEAIRLFRIHAYHEDKPLEGYDELSSLVIKYVDGLPLALKVLGSFLCGKDKNEWLSALDKLAHIPPRKVMDQLKISYDGLDNDEKDLFLDIACFHRGIKKDEATRRLDACGFNPGIGITVLVQKALLTLSSDDYIDMHDLLQEMGVHIVRGEHPNNPEKHSRVWKKNEIASMFSQNATMENDKIEAIQYTCHTCDCSPNFIKLVSNMKTLRFLDVTISDKEEAESSSDEGSGSSYNEGPTCLSNDLKYVKWSGYCASPFPESFKATKLVVLKLHHTLQKELWKGCKHLPCLKELEVDHARHLVRTFEFGGLPCLQKLTLRRCDSLKDIGPLLGNYSRLASIVVSICNKVTKFPTIVWLEKLERLTISDCYLLSEFPGIEGNLDSLVNLSLKNVGIEVFPSSVGSCCANLISLQLKNCSKLRGIEGNFWALKHLQNFELSGFTKLEWLPNDLFDENCCLDELCFDLTYSAGFIGLPPSAPHLPRLLRKLNLSGLRLNNREIPCEISELSNLQELHLCDNHFSRLDFSLIQFTRLKLLNLSHCNNLVELPQLPSNLSILQAINCDSLETIRDDVHRNCKWLCQVSVIKQVSITKSDGLCSFVGGDRLLETMLQGNAQCMSMELKGLEIPKKFKPRLVKRRRRCRLKLPENWFNEFSGFLFCCVLKKSTMLNHVVVTMTKEEKQQLQMGMGGSEDDSVDWESKDESVDSDSEDEQVFWEEENVDLHTWMGYVSFGSMRCTTWWDTTSTVVDVSIDPYLSENSLIRGFGARLVSKRNQMEGNTTTNNSSDDDDYKCKFKIFHDSRSRFKCLFKSLIQTQKWADNRLSDIL
uniref:TMV resistance protein N-like n=1 Tax=Erigeron canadensis TaxID=72917 RepID=UPI001CB9442E|nr:TMV resistance protein N-like [Erigeron canadensis]